MDNITVKQTNQDWNLVSFFQAWGPVFLWMGIIFFLSNQPKLPAPDNPWWSLIFMKTAHFCTYAALAWLTQRALSWKQDKSPQMLLIAWGISVLYAISDELHQGFVPGRHPTIADAFIDALGAAALLLVIWKVRKSAPPEPGPQL